MDNPYVMIVEDERITALENNVLLTPALIVVAPEPATILGNLSNTEKVLDALGLSGGQL